MSRLHLGADELMQKQRLMPLPERSTSMAKFGHALERGEANDSFSRDDIKRALALLGLEGQPTEREIKQTKDWERTGERTGKPLQDTQASTACRRHQRLAGKSNLQGIHFQEVRRER